MALLPILLMPDPRLRAACAPVDAFDARLKQLADDMLDTMYAAPGRGLAGPQVGAMIRLFVMDTTWKEGRPNPLVFINPVIKNSHGTAINTEGCLSIPDRTVRIERPDVVHLAWRDLAGRACEGFFEGIAATCVQHERDHLDGVLCIDYPDLPEETS
ncbi:peptide deformylase (plasmid) [Pseudorhodobacter turbinis]|uniref:Peptide deformylase n=1 Tax=Pseudorhodobacter turbinis TaxID=2500533 RepID=A0A4P8EKZ2_9RHOB|nr:peptide deformylase [Pseudorhodobacter turbinis]QCO57542.1 peptide deformylase [Pseudorhodobacter turbinis]